MIDYAYTLRDPESGAVVFRTDDAALARRYARALAIDALKRYAAAMSAEELEQYAGDNPETVRVFLRRAIGDALG